MRSGNATGSNEVPIALVGQEAAEQAIEGHGICDFRFTIVDCWKGPVIRYSLLVIGDLGGGNGALTPDPSPKGRGVPELRSASHAGGELLRG